MQQRLVPHVAAVLALCAGAQGSIYSQYTLDGPTATDTYGLTSSGKQIALGSGADAVCGQSYHMLSGDFINLGASNGAPTGNVDFSMAGHVKPVSFGGRALFAIGATFKDTDGSRGPWGAWVWVDGTGRVGVRTLVTWAMSSATLRIGEWAHVMLTYTAASTTLRLWVDGQVVLEEQVAMDLRQNSRYGGMAIGEYHLGGSPWGRGGEFFVDHVSFANSAITDVADAMAPCVVTVAPTPVPTTNIAALCAQKGAVCGAIRDGNGNTVNCGVCAAGETCSFGRCEATCSLESLGKGPVDSLAAYVPLQFAYADLSGNQHPVTVDLVANDRSADVFPYESTVYMTDKVVRVDFGQQAVAPAATLSFKLMPTAAGQSGTVLTFGTLVVAEVGGKLSVTVGGTTVPSAQELLHRSCNHAVVQLFSDSIIVVVNGHSVEQSLSVAPAALGGVLTVGRYAGKVWDVRVYERALAAAEISGLGDDCGSALSMAVPDAEYPNYLCGVYYCIYWPAGVVDTTQESFEYQLSGHDMVWEHNVMEAGMYVHGGLCAELAKARTVLLSEGYRRSWVSKFNFESPWNQYVLHENFHSYQSRTGGNTKFLAESTASWGAFAQKPTAYDTILGMYTLQPQLALWTTQSSVFEDGIIDFSKGGHQYGASIWEWYVTHHVLGDGFFIGKVYSRAVLGLAPISGTPAEGMYTTLRDAGFDMRDVFSDFAARVTTWDMDYAETFLASEIGSFNRMNNNNKNAATPLPDSEVDNKITEFYSAGGTGAAWVAVPDRYKIGDWAYNAYEVDVTADATYQVGIKPSTTNPSYSEFRAQAVVYNAQTGTRTYHKLPVTTAGVPVTVTVGAAAGEKLYLVVANTPSTKFNEFLAYTYDYLISPQA